MHKHHRQLGGRPPQRTSSVEGVEQGVGGDSATAQPEGGMPIPPPLCMPAPEARVQAAGAAVLPSGFLLKPVDNLMDAQPAEPALFVQTSQFAILSWNVQDAVRVRPVQSAASQALPGQPPCQYLNNLQLHAFKYIEPQHFD